MSEYFATIKWTRAEQSFLDNKYSRGHDWEFDGGLTVSASSSPHIVPLPYSVAESVDPEEAFVASLSSCHMLFFLSIAAKRKLVVNNYIDKAVGTMSKDDLGKISMTRVLLRPEVWFSDNEVSLQELEEMHHQAHEECFIANSVKTEVIVEIVIT
jgi:organic hydroperoxide reductase OsmC/OhrA